MHAMFVLHLTIVINLDQPLNVKTFLRSMASKPSHMEALCMSYIKDLMAKITKQPTIICNVMEDSDQHLYIYIYITKILHIAPTQAYAFAPPTN